MWRCRDGRTKKNHLSVLRSIFETLARRLDKVRFHQKAPKRTFLTKREAGVLLGAIENRASGRAGGAGDGVRAERRRRVKMVLAARDHAAFSAMVYAGLRIEEKPRP